MFTDWHDLVTDALKSALNTQPLWQYFPANCYERTDQGETYYFDMPGTDVETVTVRVEGDTLSVTGQRTVPTSYTFAYNIPYSEEVDPNAADATLRNGVLKVFLPRRPESQPKSIKVTVH